MYVRIIINKRKYVCGCMYTYIITSNEFIHTHTYIYVYEYVMYFCRHVYATTVLETSELLSSRTPLQA